MVMRNMSEVLSPALAFLISATIGTTTLRNAYSIRIVLIEYLSVSVSVFCIYVRRYEYLWLRRCGGADRKSNPYRVLVRYHSNPKSADSTNLTVPGLVSPSLPFPSQFHIGVPR